MAEGPARVGNRYSGEPICSSCRQRRPLALVSRASGDNLELVCRECFFVAELRSLLWVLPSDDLARRIASDGLETIYQLLRERVLERERVYQTDRR